MWQEMTSRDLRWPEVTRKTRHLTASHLEVAVAYRKLAYTMRLTSYKAVFRGSRQWRDKKWLTWAQVTGSIPEVTSFDRKSYGSDSRMPKTGIYCAFDFLQGCSSQEEVVTWQEMTSRDVRWPEVTLKWRRLTESHLEVAGENRKLAYIVRLTSYKAVAHRRRYSRDRKWRHVTSGDRKWPWSDVVWPEVTWKWL